jgi:hypothetical protein
MQSVFVILLVINKSNVLIITVARTLLKQLKKPTIVMS